MSALRRIARSKAAAAMLSQGVVAGSSLVLQILASRRLGSEGLGRFSLLVAILITLNSVQSGWIGDSLNVLDRFDPAVRRALLIYQCSAFVIVGTFGVGLALLIQGVGLQNAAIFGGACVLWAAEETGRRLLIARRDFWPLALNDAVYAISSFTYLGLIAATGYGLTLTHLLISLVVGATAAIAVALLQLPRTELVSIGRARAQMREVAGFAVWRAAQVGLRPGSLAAVRAIVIGTASVAALGQLEGARLMVAPILTVANGAAVYLLPTYVAAVREHHRFRPAIPVAMAGLGATCGVYGLVAIVFSSPLTRLLTAGSYDISKLAIVSWVVFAAGFTMGIPLGTAVIAHGASRQVFWARGVDNVVGVILAGTFAAMGWLKLVPVGLAVGTFLGMFLLHRCIRNGPASRSDDVAIPGTT